MEGALFSKIQIYKNNNNHLECLKRKHGLCEYPNSIQKGHILSTILTTNSPVSFTEFEASYRKESAVSFSLMT